MKKIIITQIFILALSLVAVAQKSENRHEIGKRNGLSVFLGATTNTNATDFTVGVDYQYRITKLIGIGGVLDYAAFNIKSLLIAPAVFFHVADFEIVIAPGAEFSRNDINAIIRVGGSYEFEISEIFTISPSLIFDSERNLEESLVYGLALGFKL